MASRTQRVGLGDSDLQHHARLVHPDLHVVVGGEARLATLQLNDFLDGEALALAREALFSRDYKFLATRLAEDVSTAGT